MSIYYDTILSISTNKYIKTYLRICEQAQNRASSRAKAKRLLGYTEKHHILPISFCLGGRTDAENYAFLSAREHFVCLKLLVFGFRTNTFYYIKCLKAMRAFTQISPVQQRILSSHDFDFVRRCCSLNQTGRNNHMFGKISSMRGIPRSSDVKLKLSKANKGRKLPPRSSTHLSNFTTARKGKSLVKNIGKIWIVLDSTKELKWIAASELKSYLAIGWRRGMK